MSLTSDAAADLASKIESIISDPQLVLALEDDAMRHRLCEAGRKLSYALESPGDTLWRLGHASFELVLAHIGNETKTFDTLSELPEKSSLSNDQLAHMVNVDPSLMKRLLRYYQAHGMILQTEDDGYGPSNITKHLASHSGHVCTQFFHETLSPGFMALPQFLREHEYKNVIDPNDCAWHIGHRTKDNAFQWLQKRPEHENVMSAWMGVSREGLPMFLSVVDVKDLAKGADASTPVFVDIGGGLGHQCIAVKQKHPGLAGRIILQDQATVIDHVRSNPPPLLDGIEMEAHDFFQEQPIKGARAYYMRYILHDWPNHKCKEILHGIKAAMSQDSVLLIDEKVLPERHTSWRDTNLDMVTMSCLAATERSELEWRALLDDAGFKITDIRKYVEELSDSVIFAVPK